LRLKNNLEKRLVLKWERREGETKKKVDVTRMGSTAFQTSGAIQKGVPTNVDLSNA
jgi:hypothetical protein